MHAYVLQNLRVQGHETRKRELTATAASDTSWPAGPAASLEASRPAMDVSSLVSFFLPVCFTLAAT